MEQTSLQRLQQLHPKVKDIAIAAYNEAVKATPAGIHPFITQTLRTFQESNQLYALGRTVVNPDGKSAQKPMGNIVTNAPGGSSYHNYGLALDFVILKNNTESWNVDQNWMTVVNIFKKNGFTWGGDFKSLKDEPHFEMTFGHNWRDLLVLYNGGKFIPGTQFVQI